MKQFLGRDKPQDGISQEFELLIVADSRALRRL